VTLIDVDGDLLLVSVVQDQDDGLRHFCLPDFVDIELERVVQVSKPFVEVVPQLGSARMQVVDVGRGKSTLPYRLGPLYRPHRLSRGTAPHEREYPRRKDRF